MLSINTNLSSLIAQQSLSSSTAKLNQAIERMSTGFKINHAKDNAANYSISTNMTTKINAYMVAEDNVAMGLDMLSTANGSLDQISDKLTRIRSLATQASNGTYGAQSLNAINSEVNALVDEINRLYSTAEYNGIKLFGKEQAEPAAASYAMARAGAAGGPGSFYTDEEIAAMTTITDAGGTFSDGTTYSINSVDELENFRDLVCNGEDGYGAKFVLTTDLDLSSISNWRPIGDYEEDWSFEGTFDGNGYVISNLTIDSTIDAVGLFGCTDECATIQNLGLENVIITSTEDNVGGLVGYAYNTTITNCYVTGSVKGGNYVGGLVGTTDTTTITNCYVTGSVEGGNYVGGLTGAVKYTNTITNCYVTGSVEGGNNVGGLVGYTYTEGDTSSFTNNYSTCDVNGNRAVGELVGNLSNRSGDIILDNNYATGDVIGNNYVGGFIGEESRSECTYTNNASVGNNTYGGSGVTQMTAEEIAAIYTHEMMGFTEANGWTIVNGQPVAGYSIAARNANNNGGGGSGGVTGGSNYITLQVGVNADSYSQIGLEFGFSLDGLDALREIGNDTTTDFLTQLDNMLATVSAKQTEYGAAQNRLESALDEISTAYENLVSTRSTIRDADIAEESSEYIRQQILQQASATLLATANQSPSIALQLI